MKKITVCIVTALLLFFALFFAVPREATVTDFAMDTVVSITVRSRNPKRVARLAMDEVKRVENLMSATLPQSGIYAVNSQDAGRETAVSDEVYELVKMCLEVSDRTDGAFDISVEPLLKIWNIKSPEPTVPNEEQIEKALELVNYKNIVLNPKTKSITLKKEGMKISLGAVAKGYAADMAVKKLKENGVEDALIDLGGNIYALGQKKIGIQTPFEERGKYFTVCDAEDTSVVTSGAYERYFEEEGNIYHHILDTRSGYPADSGLLSATVVAENSALADALSTALFAMGEERAESVISSFDGVWAILLTEDKRIAEIN